MNKKKKHISSIILFRLLLIVVITFVVTSQVAYFYLADKSRRTAETTIDSYTHLDIDAFAGKLGEKHRENLKAVSNTISLNYEDPFSLNQENRYELNRLLQRWCRNDFMSELALVDSHGKVVYSSSQDLIGYDLSGDGRYAELLSLFDEDYWMIGECEDAPLSEIPVHLYLAERIREKNEDEDLILLMGTTLEDEEAICREVINEYLTTDMSMFTLGEDGIVMRADEDLVVTAGNRPDLIGKLLPEIGIPVERGKEYSQLFHVRLQGENVFAYGDNTLGFYIFYILTEKEVLESPLETLNSLLLVMGLVCLSIYLGVTILIHNRVSKNIRSLAGSLSAIAEGNLDEELNVRDSIEFDSLSDDINTTVNRLKELIDQAARRIDEELAFAKVIQTSSLPSVSAMSSRKEIALDAFMATAKEVGGDFYDFFFLGKDKVCLVIADVSGKGISAALFMMRSEALIRHRALQGGTPGEILTYVNDSLCEGNESGLFVTVWLAILELSTGKGTAVNAGHENPIVRRGSGEFAYVKYPHFPMLGVWEGTKYESHDFELKAGDCLFVYTDGVMEADNGKKELFGEQRVLDALNSEPDSSAQQLIMNLRSSISDFVGEADQFDDITMLCVEYLGAADSR